MSVPDLLMRRELEEIWATARSQEAASYPMQKSSRWIDLWRVTMAFERRTCSSQISLASARWHGRFRPRACARVRSVSRRWPRNASQRLEIARVRHPSN